MDFELQKRVEETVKRLQNIAPEEVDMMSMDPVARLMLVAMEGETQKIIDQLNRLDQRIADRFCSHFVPYRQIEATPAMTLLAVQTKRKEDKAFAKVTANAVFNPKNKLTKQPLNYIPLFAASVMPCVRTFVVTHHLLKFDNQQIPVAMDAPNTVYVGIQTLADVESLQGVSLLFSGTDGIAPECISVGSEHVELNFATMAQMENIEMLEPFDAQQASTQTFAFYEAWKDQLMRLDQQSLIFITDTCNDRDVFKRRTYPKEFQQWLEDEALAALQTDTLWLKVDFPKGYTVPDHISVTPNVIPVVNVDVCSLTLTQAAPIAKLQKQEDAFFLGVLETTAAGQKQGYEKRDKEVIIRDFDAACYHDGELYRDVRYLYNQFIDDYYAFVEYNKIKDGELLKRLRQTINDLGKSVIEDNKGEGNKFKYDSGTYAMKSLDTTASAVKVSYITTQGEAGNTPAAGDIMENKKLPALAREAKVVVQAMCGTDKASADSRYELLRYYSLTADRLYTKMDIDAFLRKEVMLAFGKKEFQRISIKMNIEGTQGEKGLKRGLYIDIEFRDYANYERAVKMTLDEKLRQKILYLSCLSMPVIVSLKNLDV